MKYIYLFNEIYMQFQLQETLNSLCSNISNPVKIAQHQEITITDADFP